MRKIFFCLFLFLMMLTSAAKDGNALSPPQWLYYDYLYHTVGRTSGVQVQEPVHHTEGKYYTIDIVVNDQSRREALATLVIEHAEGDEPGYVRIRVVDESGNVQSPIEISGTTEEKLSQLRDLVLDAFSGSPYFYKVVTVEPGSLVQMSGVYIIFRPRLIQFFTDDISDYYSRSTYVARDLFKKILHSSISDIEILPSTMKFASL